MRASYHPDTDTALLDLVEGIPDVEGQEVADGVIVHFDGDDRPVRIEIYDRAREKLAGLIPADFPVGEPDDELALAVGRAWLAGYRAGRSEERASLETPRGGHDA